MARPREVLIVLALVAAAIPADAEPARERSGDKPAFSASEFGKRKEPITVSSDMLEYDYKANVVVYRGDVQAIQGPVKVRSDTLTVTLESNQEKTGPEKPGDDKPGLEAMDGGTQRLRQILATGRVRIDHGTRWATGGRAIFDQKSRTIVLTETPVLHDGANEVMGDRVVVYLDEDRSVVEGGRKRVKAVLYPDKNEGLTPQKGDGSTPQSPSNRIDRKPGGEASAAAAGVGAASSR
jgi:lipopolysaccharide export system protein LptA